MSWLATHDSAAARSSAFWCTDERSRSPHGKRHGRELPLAGAVLDPVAEPADAGDGPDA